MQLNKKVEKAKASRGMGKYFKYFLHTFLPSGLWSQQEDLQLWKCNKVRGHKALFLHVGVHKCKCEKFITKGKQIQQAYRRN